MRGCIDHPDRHEEILRRQAAQRQGLALRVHVVNVVDRERGKPAQKFLRPTRSGLWSRFNWYTPSSRNTTLTGCSKATAISSASSPSWARMLPCGA